MIVTLETHPNLFRALQLIDLDNGRINREEPAAYAYHVPRYYDLKVEVAERYLEKLDARQLTEFCCGEETERLALLPDEPARAETDELLTEHAVDQWALNWPCDETAFPRVHITSVIVRPDQDENKGFKSES